MKIRLIAISILSVTCISIVTAQTQRNLLVSSITKEALSGKIATGTSWVPFPAYTNRQGWEKIAANYRKGWIDEGEKLLSYKWQIVPASSFIEYVRTGNRDTMQDVNGQNNNAVKKLLLAELAEGKGRFIPQLADGIWSLCEMTSWALSAHISAQKKGVGLPDVTEPIIDLGVGNTAAMLAWTHYFLKDEFNKISPLIAERIEYEINNRVLQPYYTRDDFWWMSFKNDKVNVNNWNVWVNFNSLSCILLIEKDPQKRLDGLYKSMRSVDKFINYYKDDGGCEEGPAYWSHAGGMLYQYLNLLKEGTNGAVNIFSNQLVGNIGSYIYKAYINDRYYINYADAAAKLNPDAGLVYRYGQSTGDNMLKDFGTYLAQQQDWKKALPAATVEETVENALMANDILAGNSHKPLLKDFWMPGTQIMGARDKEGTTDGFYFSALGGHNAESHNHNDVGTCILFYNGLPVLIDIGSGTYTRQTFGPERYTIWTMQSAYHNLPLINGVQQKEGAQYKALNPSFKSSNSTVNFSLDIAAAYPENAAVNKWIRSYDLQRGKSFTIIDNFDLKENNGSTELHFMTPCTVDNETKGLIKFAVDNQTLHLKYDATKWAASVEPVNITDKRLLQSWPATVYRIVLKLTDKKTTGKSSILITKSAN